MTGQRGLFGMRPSSLNEWVFAFDFRTSLSSCAGSGRCQPVRCSVVFLMSSSKGMIRHEKMEAVDPQQGRDGFGSKDGPERVRFLGAYRRGPTE